MWDPINFLGDEITAGHLLTALSKVLLCHHMPNVWCVGAYLMNVSLTGNSLHACQLALGCSKCREYLGIAFSFFFCHANIIFTFLILE